MAPALTEDESRLVFEDWLLHFQSVDTEKSMMIARSLPPPKGLSRFTLYRPSQQGKNHALNDAIQQQSPYDDDAAVSVDTFFQMYPECMRDDEDSEEEDTDDETDDGNDQSSASTVAPPISKGVENKPSLRKMLSKKNDFSSSCSSSESEPRSHNPATKRNPYAAPRNEANSQPPQQQQPQYSQQFYQQHPPTVPNPYQTAPVAPPPQRQMQPPPAANPYAKRSRTEMHQPPPPPPQHQPPPTWDANANGSTSYSQQWEAHHQQQRQNPFQTALDLSHQQQQQHRPDPPNSSCSTHSPPPPPPPAIRESLKRKFQPPKRNNTQPQNQRSGGGAAPLRNHSNQNRNTTSQGATSKNYQQQQQPDTNDGDDNDDDLPEELKKYGKELVEAIESEIIASCESISFAQIAGLDDQKAIVKEVVCWPMKRPELFTGLRRAPNGLLLYGPPGTGKTLIGKAIAHESTATFFGISSSSLTSKWMGQGEKLVRTLFAVAAYREPAVVFIDEIDSLLKARSSDENEATRRIKTEFLVQIDGVGSRGRVLVIGATNRPQELDDAARRRFTKRLYIPLPAQSDREALLRVLLNECRHSLQEEGIQQLATESAGFSGADLKSMASDAALGPIRELSSESMDSVDEKDIPPVELRHFQQALASMKPSVSPQDITQYEEWDELFGSKRAPGTSK